MRKGMITGAACAMLLAACSPGTAYDASGTARGSVPYTYLTFDQYAGLIEGCDEAKILARIEALDLPDLPRIPLAGVRLCRAGLLVLDVESTWATQEFKIVAPDRRKFYSLALQWGGSRCAGGDGCDVVTDEECDDDPACEHFRLVHLANQFGDGITSAFIRSREPLEVTDDDLAAIAVEGEEKTLFFHLGETAYMARDGAVGPRERSQEGI